MTFRALIDRRQVHQQRNKALQIAIQDDEVNEKSETRLPALPRSSNSLAPPPRMAEGNDILTLWLRTFAAD